MDYTMDTNCSKKLELKQKELVITQQKKQEGKKKLDSKTERKDIDKGWAWPAMLGR